MELVLQIFPYANAEIVTAAAGSFYDSVWSFFRICFTKVQGE
jgi:hypothetical protein